METSVEVFNAGQRLLAAQKFQRTNLCVGLDPHVDDKAGLDYAFYSNFARPALTENFQNLVSLSSEFGFARCDNPINFGLFMAGVTEYFLNVVDVAWDAGIRVFKPQSAFYEQFNPFGEMILHCICKRIHDRGAENGDPYFIILDAKRGDISSTQRPYFAAYLAGQDDLVVPYLSGQYDFDTMTITTWMGEDVILPGMDWFKRGKGAIIVTRSSNPSGTTLQDAFVMANLEAKLSSKQKPYCLTAERIAEVYDLIGRVATNADVMFHLTEGLSKTNELATNGASSLFSVVGSTVIEDGSFRKLRPTGIALVPGFGAQGGSFEKAMPLIVNNKSQDEDQEVDEGQGGIFSSSRGHNFSWMKRYGGSGDPKNFRADTTSAIENFREAEKKAYEAAGIHYPYAA